MTRRESSFFVGVLVVAATALMAVNEYLPANLFGDAYSDACYFAQVTAGLHGPSPTITTPKPLPILWNGFWFHVTHRLGAIATASNLLTALMIVCLALFAERLRQRAGWWCALLLITWSELWLMAAQARASILCGLGLAIALERASARRFATAGIGLALAGLVRPEPWLIAAIVTAAGVVVARRTRTRPAWRIAGLVGLLAPLLWIAFDHFAFGDPWFTQHVTKLWQSRFGADAPTGDLGSMALAMAKFLAAAVLIGNPIVLGLALIGAILLQRDTRAGLLLVFAALTWLGVMIAYGLLGWNTAPRFAEPAIIGLVSLAGVALAIIERRLVPGRARWLLRIAAFAGLACSWQRGMDRDHAVRMSIAQRNEQLAHVIDQASAASADAWLVDNDVASYTALATRLGVGRTLNLQQDLVAPATRPIAGVVIDDRMYRPKGGTLARLAPRLAGWQTIYEQKPGVLVLVPATK